MNITRSLRSTTLALTALAAVTLPALHASAQTVTGQSIVVNPVSPVSVGSLTLINVDTGQPVPGYNPIPSGTTLNLAALPKRLSIRANTVGPVQSVLFGLDGNLNYHSENVAPFSLCDGSDCATALRPGQHTIVATPFTGTSGGGIAGLGLSVTYSVVGTAQTPAPAPTFGVTSFTLINADTNQPVPGYDPIQPGARLQLSALPKRLNFRVNTAGNVRSIRFVRPSGRVYVENEAPFALCGDTKGSNGRKGDYLACAAGELTVGNRRISAAPFTEMFAKGKTAQTYTLPFTIVR
ncbi:MULTISPECIES: hypothetical protein [Deinococcus]|uniref:Uncharacterized protein n=1 Tax=Deinococcus rufus TaxID=2136097 RepID=A0ABV7Z4X9_9DEIO|nr:hypothetical protein [Deinococcus sp. AB2017081]WQE95919.1 hypothetical protein U2P90_03255 [Deinococcus sp. AB2017081]